MSLLNTDSKADLYLCTCAARPLAIAPQCGRMLNTRIINFM